jgi:hypothetical protein
MSSFFSILEISFRMDRESINPEEIMASLSETAEPAMLATISLAAERIGVSSGMLELLFSDPGPRRQAFPQESPARVRARDLSGRLDDPASSATWNAALRILGAAYCCDSLPTSRVFPTEISARSFGHQLLDAGGRIRIVAI